jgi:putative NADH-flavin reductase
MLKAALVLACCAYGISSWHVYSEPEAEELRSFASFLLAMHPAALSGPRSHRATARQNLANEHQGTANNVFAVARRLTPVPGPSRRARIDCSIAVFGATGATGSEAVYQALAQGEEVTCLARDPSKMMIPEGSGGDKGGTPLSDEKLTIFKGSVTEQADVDKVFEGKKVTGVVVALGGKTKDVGPTMLQDGTANIIRAMKANDVKRISVVTTIGAGDSMDQAPWAFRLLMMTVMSSIMADKNKQEELFLNGIGADLEYTLVRPGGLKTEPPNGIVNVIDGEAGAITRADVAAFCLEAVLEPDFAYIKQAPCISSDKGSGFASVLADKTKSRMAKE